MRRVLVACASLMVLASGSVAGAGTGTDTGIATHGDIVGGRYIVVLEDGVDAPAVARLHEARFDIRISHTYTHALQGYAAAMDRDTARLIAQLPGVRWVEADRAVATTAQTVPTGINRAEADLSPTARINGSDERVDVDVAVIDTGIDLSHPDLNVRSGKNCVLSLAAPTDANGHGTHVAGTIGALDNTTGVVGVAPGARVWAVKVLTDAGTGLNSAVICGIDWVTANAGTIEVANMSLGGAGTDDGNCGNSSNDALHKAICRSVSSGVTYAVAAGNDAKDAKGFTPAAYDEVITVSALADFNGVGGGGARSTCRSDVDDTFADYSNYGADVDLIAPGTCINSTWILGGYNTISGTSMASPHVAGGAALFKVKNPSASPAQVKAALQNAGTLDWTWPSQDKDGVQERLLNVSTF